MPSGNEIVNTYGNGKLQSIQTPEGETTFTYFCGSKVQSITRGDEAMAFTYDGSLLTSLSQTGELNATLEFAYNSDFDITSLTYAGGAVLYSYDNDGLLTGAGDFTIERDANNGLLLAVSDVGNGGALALSREFTQFGEQAGSSVTVNGSELFAWEVERDNAGRITSKTETLDGTSTLYEYAYDSLGRLTEVTANGAIKEEYAYGANGARSLETNAWRDIDERSYSYGADHRLLQAGDTTYEYDADGFLTSKTVDGETTTYTYASTGELLAVGLPDGSTIAYENDALGRRVAKYVDGVVTEKYLWQGRTQLLAVYNADGSLKSRFLYADARMPVAMETGGQTYYLACDQVGSLRAVANASGTVVKTITYDSFGNVLEDSNEALEVPFGFAGGLYDADTGLVRFGYRDYDAEVGRWTAKDPIGFAGGDSDLYGYVNYNPIYLIDSNGQEEYPDDFVGPLPENGYHSSEMTRTKCGKIPPAPPCANIDSNIELADDKWYPIWFYNQGEK